MKKILSLVLALALLCGCTAFAEPHEHDRWLPEYVYSGEIKLPEYMNTESYFPHREGRRGHHPDPGPGVRRHLH